MQSKEIAKNLKALTPGFNPRKDGKPKASLRKKPELKPTRVATRPRPTKSTATSTSENSSSKISSHMRQRMIAEAAYYRSEKRGFSGNPVDDWLEAENELKQKMGE